MEIALNINILNILFTALWIIQIHA